MEVVSSHLELYWRSYDRIIEGISARAGLPERGSQPCCSGAGLRSGVTRVARLYDEKQSKQSGVTRAGSQPCCEDWSGVAERGCDPAARLFLDENSTYFKDLLVICFDVFTFSIPNFKYM